MSRTWQPTPVPLPGGVHGVIVSDMMNSEGGPECHVLKLPVYVLASPLEFVFLGRIIFLLHFHFLC